MAILLSKSKTIKVADNSHFILPEKRKLSAALIEYDERKDAAITTKANLLIFSLNFSLAQQWRTQGEGCGYTEKT